ncbi:MAG: hypothetical protein KDJ97_09300 [Anaerolineae bacterium]|nr:hypothetical protein [Anaerolineae bacterium]
MCNIIHFFRTLRPTPYALRPTTYVLPLIFFLLLLLLTSCQPSPLPPSRLYLFDVTDLHLNHYEQCLAMTGAPDQCDADTPPPEGKSYADLLRDYDTLIFLTTLQGIVNRDQPRLYLNHDHSRGDAPGVDQFWLDKYQEAGQPYGWLADTEIVEIDRLDDLLDRFADDIEGVVVWDPAVPATLNVATTIAGVENLAVLRAGSDLTAAVTDRLEIKKSLVDLFQPGATTLPDSTTPSSGSPKTDAYLWAKEQYLDTGRANAQFLAYLLDGWPAVRYAQEKMTRGGVYALERDYVVQQRGFAFDLSPWPDELPNDDPEQPLGADAATLQTVVEAAEAQAGGLIKVWGFIPWYEKYSSAVGGKHLATEGEWASTWLFSQHGSYLQGGAGDVFGVAMANVSVHKFGPPPAARDYPEPPTETDLIAQGYLTPEGQVAPDRTFVMFYAGDYDLAHPVQVLLANYGDQPWLDARRGQVPLAWGFNPALVEDIPAIMTYLYQTKTDQDYFVGANSGAGYVNPDGLSDWQFLRWLWRTRGYYADYGYDVQGFLLNGNGAQISQRRLSAFTFLAPVGILSPDYQTDEPWPRLQWDTPIATLPTETLFGNPDIGAEAIHTIYKRTVLTEGRPPFLAVRAAFQSPSLLWGVQEQLQAHQAEERITNDEGDILQPNYTVVDPYTFFFLLKRYLNEQP